MERFDGGGDKQVAGFGGWQVGLGDKGTGLFEISPCQRLGRAKEGVEFQVRTRQWGRQRENLVVICRRVVGCTESSQGIRPGRFVECFEESES